MWTVKRRGDNGLMQEVEVKSLDDLFKRQEDGTFAVKTQIKTYNDDRTTPKQYMQDGTKASEGFELTTDSVIHVMVQLKAWSNPNACGISIRPRGVMVVELADKVEREETGSMFGDLVTQGDNPFNDLATGSQAQRAEDVDPFGLPAVESRKTAPQNNTWTTKFYSKRKVGIMGDFPTILQSGAGNHRKYSCVKARLANSMAFPAVATTIGPAPDLDQRRRAL